MRSSMHISIWRQMKLLFWNPKVLGEFILLSTEKYYCAFWILSASKCYLNITSLNILDLQLQMQNFVSLACDTKISIIFSSSHDRDYRVLHPADKILFVSSRWTHYSFGLVRETLVHWDVDIGATTTRSEKYWHSLETFLVSFIWLLLARQYWQSARTAET